jgi:biopolymer transport protein TolQ
MDKVIETVTLGNGTAFGNDIINMVMQAGPVAKLVLLLLILFSLASWGIILDKYLLFRRNAKAGERFLNLFRKASSFDEVTQKLKNLTPDPLARIFMSGFRILKRQSSEEFEFDEKRDNSMKLFELAIDESILIEIQRMEKRLSFLGTCGSVTPFIGLFGTVWGIMNAFRGIGQAGSASIAAVAPGIAEALITTAAGLVAAIPAVMAYNYFLGKIKSAAVLFEQFRTNFIASIE